MKTVEFVVHLLVALAAVLLVAHLGRALARWSRQPAVIGEILCGLVAGPIMIAVAGPDSLRAMVPPGVLAGLDLVGQAGLALFLVGVAHELRRHPSGLPRRAVGCVTAGSLVPPLAMGLVLAAWVLGTGDPRLHGVAPEPAVVLMICVSMAVTAVPVLARILVDRGMTAGIAGRLAMSAAVVIDTAAWLLLAVALGLSTGGVGGLAISLGVLMAGLLAALTARALLRRQPVDRLLARFPIGAAVTVGAAALAASTGMREWGLTGVFGAFLVGLALPAGDAWSSVVTRVARIGGLLVPVFFVVAVLQVFDGMPGDLPWLAVLLTTTLAIAGKVGGGYLGGVLGGLPRHTALTVGVLMNTRGLTEIVVLQAGYSAGLLSPALFLALIVMALVTTALTGPLLSLIGHVHGRDAAPPVGERRPRSPGDA